MSVFNKSISLHLVAIAIAVGAICVTSLSDTLVRASLDSSAAQVLSAVDPLTKYPAPVFAYPSNGQTYTLSTSSSFVYYATVNSPTNPAWYVTRVSQNGVVLNEGYVPNGQYVINSSSYFFPYITTGPLTVESRACYPRRVCSDFTAVTVNINAAAATSGNQFPVALQNSNRISYFPEPVDNPNAGHLTATFTMNIAALGGDAVFGSSTQAFKFVLRKNGVVVGSIIPYGTAYYPGTQPTGSVNYLPNSGGFTIPRNAEIIIPVTFKLDLDRSSALHLGTGNFTVALETINYTVGGVSYSKSFANDLGWITPEIQATWPSAGVPVTTTTSKVAPVLDTVVNSEKTSR